MSRLGGLCAVLIASLAVLAVTGCTAGSSARETDSLTSPATKAYLQDAARALAEDLGITDPPVVHPVKLIALEDWARTQIGCLKDAGFDAEFTPDGEGIRYPSLSDEALVMAFNTARYTCEVTYPVSPKYTRPLSDARLHALYEYRSAELIRCLEDKGFTPSNEIPSEAAFVESGGAWSPYEDLEFGTGELTATSQACPETPTDFYGD